jgi:hypothetical protein
MMACFAVTAFAAAEKASPVAPPEIKAKKADASGESTSLSGKVVETMDSSGYTYVCLEKNGKKTWVAVPQMKVTVGKEMSFIPGTQMGSFTSKSLNKTFDQIIFSAGPETSPQAAGANPHSDKESAGKQATGSKSAASSAHKDIKVEKAAGPNAYTVAEVFAKQKDLNAKPVVVKGQVVKVSAGIMGTNFIHLQDGTGDPKKSTHNLVITSSDLPSVGDVVTVKGTLTKDKDFWSGYKYAVIIEKAAVTK